MYLKGLNDAGFATRYGTAPASTYQSGTQTVPNMTQNACSSQGGSWRTYNPNVMTFNSPGDCVLPVYSALPAAPAPPPQINVSVPTNVNTQVSPQISPNLIQQEHPTNSPVNASTSSQPSQSAAPDNSAYLKQLQEQQSAFMAAMAKQQADRDAAMLAAQQTPPPNPAPAQQVPQTVTEMVPSYAGDGGYAPASASSTPAVADTGFSQYMHYWPYALLAVAAVGIFAVSSKKKQRKGN